MNIFYLILIYITQKLLSLVLNNLDIQSSSELQVKWRNLHHIQWLWKASVDFGKTPQIFKLICHVGQIGCGKNNHVPFLTMINSIYNWLAFLIKQLGLKGPT